MRKRLFCILLTFSLLSVLIIALVACVVSYRRVMDMAVTTSEQLVEKTASEIDDLLDDMASVTRVISRDSGVQAVMRTQYAQYKDQFSDRFELDAYLSKLNQYNDNIFAMYFFADNGLAAKSRYYTFRDENITESPYYRQVLRTEGTVWLPPSAGSHFAVTTGETLLTTITPVKEVGSGQYRGAVVVELEVGRVRSLLETRVSKNGFLYLRDAEGNPLVWPEEAQPEALGQAPRVSPFGKAFSDLKIEKELDANGWAIVCTVPGRELAKNIIDIITVVCLVSVCVIVLALALAHRCAALLVQPIIALDETMQRVERGDLNARAVTVRSDEIGALNSRFNLMIETIQTLMEHEIENQKKLRLTEFKALQAQIQPHFLYNTLDSIIWMARAGNNGGVVRMVLALTRFLKIGLSRGKETITVREELEHARSYLIIQNIRYKDQFAYEITADPAVEGCAVPKLVLQPLIENAIYHGMKQKREACRLVVWARREQDHLAIDVMDNGAGMTPERAAALRNTLRGGPGPRADSYGVANVHERIRILFGERYGVSFESKLGEGCCFRLTLPIQGEEEKQDEGSAGG
ncbi:MAG: sensor histidine kinase [Eubacteriales bacterium]|nr:sensor histidine kinase [Eubacteriales bacterium]